MGSRNPTTNLRRVEFRLSEDDIERLDQLAHDLSEPGPDGRVSRADVLREAVEQFDPDVENVDVKSMSEKSEGRA